LNENKKKKQSVPSRNTVLKMPDDDEREALKAYTRVAAKITVS
jgi:hypothetical protein